jgi:beta-phosphoglucomutase-like phosphatase (HAD superfamily)
MSCLIVYDFDGVIAESEVLANSVLAEIVTELGVPTTLQDSYRLYMGKRFVDVISAVQTRVGRALPATFALEYQAVLSRAFAKNYSSSMASEATSTLLRMCRGASLHRPHRIASPCALKCSDFNPSSAHTSSVPQLLPE